MPFERLAIQYRRMYKERIADWEGRHGRTQKKLKNIAMQRLLLFAGAVLFFVLGAITLPLLAWLGVPCVVGFLILVRRYAAEFRESEIESKILELNRKEQAFLEGDKSVFSGSIPGLPEGHIYAADLDIFGKGSLFQSIHRTATWEGSQRVASALLNLSKDAGEIDAKREAVKELSNRIDWRQRLYAVGQLTGESPTDMSKVRLWLAQEQFVKKNTWAVGAAWGCSALSIGLIVWTIFNQFYPLLFLLLAGFNYFIRSAFATEIDSYFLQFGSRTKLFQKFSELFRLVSSAEFSSSLLKKHHARIEEASVAFLELSQLSNRADQRLNGLVGPFMNAFFLYDIWCIRSIEQWREKYGNRVDGWVGALAAIDELSSLANYRYNHPKFSDSMVEPGTVMIRAQAMGHPLLPFDESVKNDYELGVTTRAHIVTGSNMAGKSTFIRAVGLNLVLALNGLPVCAQSFRCGIMSIASCIRITDSLEEHSSYFRAELMRLEQVVQLVRTGEPYLVLLDEIMRGTNSDDKRMGTLAFYKRLRDFGCLAILATHDLEIGKLEDQYPQDFSNYCFESRLDGSTLQFDYKLRRGVSASTNATFLMKSLGLID